MEEWKEIPGYPGYEASTLGRIRCWRPRNARAKAPPAEPRIVKPTFTHGYAHVSLSINGLVRRCRVHVLVLTTYRGPCPPGCQGRHVNERDKLNNALVNLAWGTPKENQADRVRHGTDLRGSQVLTSKLTELLAAEVYAASGTHEAIAAQYGVTRKVVSLIKSGSAWKHATAHLRGEA